MVLSDNSRNIIKMCVLYVICLWVQIWTYNIMRAWDMKNMEISRGNMGIGDIETHTDRPRCSSTSGHWEQAGTPLEVPK